MNWFATHAYIAEWAALAATLFVSLFSFKKNAKVARGNLANG